MFIDEAEIYVKGGNGGSGCMSFRREKFEDLGGPDGGDGGDGGNVILRAIPGIDTLLDFKGKHHWKARNGQPGQGRCKTGACGEDLVVNLPLGTLVYDRDTGVMLKDLACPGDECLIAAGGKHGRGNKAFATATQQAPREFEPGQPGQERNLRLELKLIADVGLVGLPNAGKSTLLSRLSKARPRIASYPFTTLQPELGIVELSSDRRIVVADLPGLIEGAHDGAGLGDAFLRHIERTRVIVHMVDVCPMDERCPIESYRTVRNELAEYSETLAAKPELVVATKLDLSESEEPVREMSEAIGKEIISISSVTGRGLPILVEKLWSLLAPFREEAPKRAFNLPTPPHLRNEE